MAGGGGSGGGSSGKVLFSQHMSHWHGMLLCGYPVESDGTIVSLTNLDSEAFPSFTSASEQPFNIVSSLMRVLSYGSPYHGEEAPDPDDSISAIAARVTDIESAASSLSTSTDVSSLADTAVSVWENKIDPDSHIEDLVDEFRRERWKDADEEMGKLGAAMYGMNAAHSASYMFALADITERHGDDTNRYRKQLLVNRENERIRSVLKLIDDQQKYTLESVSAQAQVFQAEFDAQKFKMAAKTEQQRTNLDYDVQDMLWEFAPFKEVGDFLSIIQGSVVPKRDDRNVLPSAIGGLMSGVGAGVQAGSMLPGVGTGLGAGIGGALGLIGGIS